MARPKFTEPEERLIDQIRNHEATPAKVWRFYIPWIIVAVLLFAVGVLQHNPELEAAGFGIVTILLLRFIVYQTKPGWRVKPLIDKYEEALKDK